MCSKEGVLPENAGDPLGYIPKGLRKTCKIVDTRSPEYEAQHKQQEAAKEQNRQQQEFRDTLLADMDKWAQKSAADRWQADLPDGTDRAVRKYDNDYSRFNEIQEEAEAPQKDTRDYYFDEQGQMKKLEEPKTKLAAESTESALKKGFLENAKKALYPEELKQLGSEELKTSDLETLAKLSEGDLMERMNQMSPEEKSLMNDLQSLLEGKAQAAPAARLDERRSAEYSLTAVEAGHQLQIHVPELDSMRGVDLDVTQDCAAVVFPHSLQPLKVSLPVAVAPSKVKAKFSKKTHHINVTLPSA
ncbi:unnamed protein product [Effrenium voratum]|nr:unnamed protein product [Effrenium voratum]